MIMIVMTSLSFNTLYLTRGVSTAVRCRARTDSNLDKLQSLGCPECRAYMIISLNINL